jgi:hypothetical protein
MKRPGEQELIGAPVSACCWLSPGDGLNADLAPVAARECGREADNAVTGRRVDEHRAAKARGVQQHHIHAEANV